MNRGLFEEKMAQSGWDAIVVLSAENVFYLSGSPTALRFKNFQQTRPYGPRLVIALQARNGEATLITPAFDEIANRQHAWVDDVRGYLQYTVSPIEMLAQVMKDKGLAKGYIGLETVYWR